MTRASAVAVALVAVVAHAADDGGEEPFRLKRWAPAWLSFGVEHRSRFEGLERDFRQAGGQDELALSMRTLVSAEVRAGPGWIAAELQDARVYATESTPLSTTTTNPLELLRASAGLTVHGVAAADDTLAIAVGRMTIDLGSRRLVARNEFRNTINGFTGVDARYSTSQGHTVRAIAAMPVLRRPTDAEALRANAVEFDVENPSSWLFVLFYGGPPVVLDTRLEAFVVGVVEADAPGAPTSNRRLVSPGVRLVRAPRAGTVDFQVELAGQLGVSRASSAASDETDLTHLAFGVSAQVGWRFAAPWSPRVALLYDLGTGDAARTDGQNNRFDTLYGARRFELGPTGLWGALARSNGSMPGLRVEVSPAAAVDGYLAYRAIWLASSTDAWTSASLRDPAGGSGLFVGQQLDGRVRVHVLPQNLTVDAGAAVLFPGEFAIATSGRATPSLYGYVQLTVWL